MSFSRGSKSCVTAATACLAFCLTFVNPARAGFVIDVTYTNVPTAAQTAFNEVVADYESVFTNNETVHLAVDFGTTGLGESSTNIVVVSYANWIAALNANALANPGNFYESDGYASLPATDPIGDGDVVLRSADARALGITGAEVLAGNLDPTDDSTLTFTNTANTFEYNGVATSGLYDFMDVATHELDEALAIGSALTGIANNGSLPTTCPGNAGTGGCYDAEDYFRYNGSGALDETTNPSAVVYFSYNGKYTDVAQFNQDNNAGDNSSADRNDWSYADGGCPSAAPGPYIQDAIGCPDEAVPVGQFGSPELAALNTLGYDSTQYAPEPASMLLSFCGLGLVAVIARKRLARLRCR